MGYCSTTKQAQRQCKFMDLKKINTEHTPRFPSTKHVTLGGVLNQFEF